MSNVTLQNDGIRDDEADFDLIDVTKQIHSGKIGSFT